MGVRPWRAAAATLRATSASSSPWSCRRSLWPHSAQAAAGVGELRRPRRRRCGPPCPRGGGPGRRPRRSMPASSRATAWSSGKEGKITTRRHPLPGGSARPRAGRGSSRRASARSRFIFQLPATAAGVPRARSSCLLQHGDPGQRLAGEELQRGAAARRDVADAVRRRRPPGARPPPSRRRRSPRSPDRPPAPRPPRGCRRRTAASRRPPADRSRTACGRGRRPPRTPPRLGADVHRLGPGRDAASAGTVSIRCRVAEVVGHHQVAGQQRPRCRGPWRAPGSPARAPTRSGSKSEPPRSCPSAARKVLAMPPPSRSTSSRGRRFSRVSILPSILAPPSRAANGRSGSPSRRPRASTSRASSRPAALALQPLGHPHHRGVGAVGGAEGVVDVDLGQGRELVGEGRIVLLLAGVEAEVLEQRDARRGPSRAPPSPPPRPRSPRRSAPGRPAAPRASPATGRRL